jgi:hypothetical protein
MKRFTMLLLTCALLSVFAVGQTTFTQSFGPNSSIAGCTAAAGVATSSIISPCGGQGAMFENANVTLHTVTWTAVAGTGAVSACTLELETSAAGSTFVLMSGSAQQTCTSSGSYTFVGGAANYVKINLNALTTTGTANVTINYSGTVTNPALGFAVNCGVSNSCAAPANVQNLKIVYGSCTAAAATTCAQTGIAPAFTSSTSYFCAASDATTAANAVFKITYVSGTAFTITDSNSSSDVFNWICWGT